MDKSFPVKLLLLLLAMLSCCAAGVYLLYLEQYTGACISFAGMLLLVWVLYKSIKQVHKKVDYFINAIANDDYTFQFPVKPTLGSSTADLSRQLNRVKEVMQQKRLAMQEQEKYYEVLLSKINAGVLLVSESGHVTQANQKALSLLGREVFTHLHQLQSSMPELYAVLHAIRSGEQHKVVFANEREQIELLVQASLVALRNQKLRIIVLNDIRQLLDEQEMENWIKLFRILAHEIMNSIAPITSLSDTLLQLHNDSSSADTLKEDTKNGLQLIHETAKGLTSFVSSYHRLLRVPTPQKERLEVSDFLNGIVVLSSHLPYFEHIHFNIEVSSDAPPLYADENLLGQVMINLVKNAVQSIERAGITQGIIHLHFQKSFDGGALLEVSDNGPGIAPELANQIFMPFFTTKSEGSGIGLSIARQIMRAHGGRIQVHSTPGQMTKFCLFFC
ncbi:MAG: ATP-binding protein [Bacteroidetes bacterium]|nr:ATP-binding protein [Bacteroidota bacterium]